MKIELHAKRDAGLTFSTFASRMQPSVLSQTRRFYFLKATGAAVRVSLMIALVFHYAADGQAKDAAPSGKNPDRPLCVLQAHAHNDYEHARPLFDALDQGFGSVEADIWLVEGKLLVAHNFADVKPERSLQAMYLDPLRECVRRNGGRIFANQTSFTLLVDVKSAAEPTYAALRELLQNYTDILSTFTPTQAVTNALMIILTGNRAMAMMLAESNRCVTIDGRLADMNTNFNPQLIPLISENWRPLFKWRGIGPFPEAEQLKLRELVGRVHHEGRRIRFWAIPDNPAGWRELQAAGVDLLNADDLPGLAKFLQPSNQLND